MLFNALSGQVVIRKLASCLKETSICRRSRMIYRSAMRVRHTIEVCTLQKTIVVVLKLIASDWLVKIELYVARLGQLTSTSFHQLPSQNNTMVTLILLQGSSRRFVESDDGKECGRGKWKVRRIIGWSVMTRSSHQRVQHFLRTITSTSRQPRTVQF
jgi:hypothetical protein